jgi:hypothetical protein
MKTEKGKKVTRDMENTLKTNEATSPRPHLDDLVYFLLGGSYSFAFSEES